MDKQWDREGGKLIKTYQRSSGAATVTVVVARLANVAEPSLFVSSLLKANWIAGSQEGRAGKEVPAGGVVTGDILDLQLGSRKSGGSEGNDSHENTRSEHPDRVEGVVLDDLSSVMLPLASETSLGRWVLTGWSFEGGRIPPSMCKGQRLVGSYIRGKRDGPKAVTASIDLCWQCLHTITAEELETKPLFSM